MDKNDAVALKSSLWYMISKFLNKGISFIIIPIIARILTKSEMGIYNNFAAWLSLLTVICTLSLHASIVSARYDYKNNLYDYIKSVILLGTIVTILFGVAFLGFKTKICEITSLDERFLWVIFIVLLITPAYSIYLQIATFEYRYKIVATLSTGISAGAVLLSFIFIFFWQNNLNARIIGSQLPLILVGIVLYGYFLKKGTVVKKEYMKYALCVSVPYMIHLLSGNILSSVDRTMITAMCSSEATALYSMAYNIAMLVGVLWDAMNSAFVPWLGEQLEQQSYTKIKSFSRQYVLIFAVGITVIMLLGPEVLYIMGGAAYIEAKVVIPPVMLGYFFMFIYSMYANIEQLKKETRAMAAGTIVAAIINLALNYIFIPKYGYVAAAYTTLAGYVFLFLFHYFIVKRMDYAHVYDTSIIFGSSVLMFVVLFVVELAYENIFMRIACMVVLCMLLFIFYKKNAQSVCEILKCFKAKKRK